MRSHKDTEAIHQTSMAIYNLSSSNTDAFPLLGILGLEQYHIWISIPFCFIYLVAIVGNSMLLYLIAVEHSLHAPMFFFLSKLAMTDLILSTTSILLAMAFDHYMAICLPLRYTTILTPRTIVKIAVGISFRSFCVIAPCVFVVNRLPFCGTHIIPHTYCEHIGVARLACADIAINIWYGFCVPIMTVIVDVILIAVSYTLILCAIFRLPSRDARKKALRICGSLVCVILMFYIPAFFFILAHRFGQNVPHTFHIMFANLYVIIPPALNSIVYGVKTKQIQDKVILLLFPKGSQ
ncbi:hypothetical protein mRhiFer1_012376 [Rhinolophus ferrumequinum]|uniref:G-protein coupled receptors family 1 profile domain-containing protein n=1 Tax=Rhinolophus ferrumequinum TaxID=59479 RepID=A0A7J7W933_RHIFE|nr:hypothetical protein mRhiFer1_012376 [Rhinolophus ferrumequinum]